MNLRHLILSLLLTASLTAVAYEPIVHLRPCRPQRHQSEAANSRSLHRQSRRTTDKLKGQRHQLLVLVSFADQSFKEEEPLAVWDPIFNEHDFSEEPFTGSVHDYFYAQSYSQLDLTFDLQLVELAEERKKYRSTSEDDENSQYLVYDIVDELSTRTIDWSLYDWDDDGYIDQLLIVYAGKGSSYAGMGGGYNAIWPHQWWLSEHEDGEVRIVSTDEKDYTIDCYCCVQELSSSGNYGSFGTICHEYSHCFGLPDFYGSSSYLHHWDVMDNGNYSGGGFRPCGYSAHERMFMGWLTPIELTEATTITSMPPTTDHATAYIIRNDAHSDEYYLIENRQQTGWDQSLPSSGIVIFHVDFDADVWLHGTPNESSHKRYHIFPANNSTSSSEVAGWAYPYQDNNQLTNESSPAATLYNANTDGTLFMSKPITEMAVTGDMASFHFSPTTTGIKQQTANTNGQLLYRFGSIDIIRTTDGKIQKVVSRP